MMIKQLNWSEDCDGDFTASSVFGAYGVFRGGHRTHNMYTPSANNPKVFDTVHEAKAAAQAHFEARIKQCLDIPVDHDGTPFKLLPVDLETHLGDFESAVKAAMSESWGDNREYWKKQLVTINRIKEQLK